MQAGCTKTHNLSGLVLARKKPKALEHLGSFQFQLQTQSCGVLFGDSHSTSKNQKCSTETPLGLLWFLLVGIHSDRFQVFMAAVI